MFASRRITAVAAAASLAGLGFVGFGATSAFAATCPTGDNCTGTVAGTVTIPTSLTLTLTPNAPAVSDAFTINTSDGVTGYAGTLGSGQEPVDATVVTNDPGGYTLAQAITSTGNDFVGGGSGTGTDAIPATAVEQGQYPGPGPTITETWVAFPSGGGSVQIGARLAATTGDTYALDYGVTPPNGTQPDTFTATFTVTGLAN